MDTTCVIGIDRSVEELPIEFLWYAYVADIQGALASIRNPFFDSLASKIFSMKSKIFKVPSQTIQKLWKPNICLFDPFK